MCLPCLFQAIYHFHSFQKCCHVIATSLHGLWSFINIYLNSSFPYKTTLCQSLYYVLFRHKLMNMCVSVLNVEIVLLFIQKYKLLICKVWFPEMMRKCHDRKKGGCKPFSWSTCKSFWRTQFVQPGSICKAKQRRFSELNITTHTWKVRPEGWAYTGVKSMFKTGIRECCMGERRTWLLF